MEDTKWKIGFIYLFQPVDETYYEYKLVEHNHYNFEKKTNPGYYEKLEVVVYKNEEQRLELLKSYNDKYPVNSPSKRHRHYCNKVKFPE